MTTPKQDTFEQLTKSSAALELQILTAYDRRNPAAELAAIDQIRAHLTPEDTRTDRAVSMALASVIYAAAELRSMIRKQGCAPSEWRIGSFPGSHRYDPRAQAVAQDALAEHLNSNTHQSAKIISGYLTDAGVDSASSLVIEAAWLAAMVRATAQILCAKHR